ncbi:unnamed protein product [Moneuplotes crassus]|uniref:Uncharacterized protein n=1 Tax=Euplotes crassus TaxID=5936 RepID=A0AAD1XUN9_EUPCR|nr:unnamed protein product [Moneuplotes crassus]
MDSRLPSAWTLVQQTEIQTNEALKKIYYQIVTESNKFFIWGKKLSLCIENIKDQSFLKTMRKIPYHHLEKINLLNVSHRSIKKIKFLLEEGIRINADSLVFEANNLSRVTAYLNLIIKISYKISHLICLEELIMNELQLKRILFAYKHVKVLQFSQCIFSLPKVPDFTKCLEGTSIKGICLANCEGRDYNDWINEPQKFENLIEGFSNSDLKDSLQEIDLWYFCELKLDFVKEVLSKHGFGHVEVLGNFDH